MRKLGILLKNNIYTTFGISKLKRTQPIKLVGYLILALYVMFSIFITFSGYARFVADALNAYNLMTLMLVIFFVMATFMIFNFSIYDTKSNLFNAKDNDLLLSLPIKTSSILASRLLRMIIWNLLLSLVMLVPAVYVYVTSTTVTFNFFINIFVAFVLLPVIPTIIASIIGYFIAYLTSKVNFKNGIEIFLSFAIVGFIYYLMANGQNLLKLFINNQEMMMNVLKWAFYPIYLIYQTFTTNNYTDLLGYVGINIAVLLLFIVLLNKNYKKIINKLQENKVKTNYVMKDMSVSSPTKALFIKEVKRYFSSPIYVFNTSSGILILFVISIATIFYNTNQILTVLAISAENASMFELMIVLILFASFLSSTTSAAISLEGKSYWILKSLPIKEMKILDSKILLNLILVLPITIISIIILKFTLALEIGQVLLLILIAIISSLVASHLGLLVNLKFPKMDAISDVVIVKRSASVMISTLVPMVIIFGLAGLYSEIIKTLDFGIIISIFIGLMIIILIAERIMLIKWGVRKFRTID